MADPRGRGFGRVYRQRQWYGRIRRVDDRTVFPSLHRPQEFGGFTMTEFDEETGRPVFERDGVFIMSSPVGWMMGDGREWAVVGTLDDVAAAIMELPIPFNGEPVPPVYDIGPADNGLGRGVDF